MAYAMSPDLQLLTVDSLPQTHSKAPPIRQVVLLEACMPQRDHPQNAISQSEGFPISTELLNAHDPASTTTQVEKTGSSGYMFFWRLLHRRSGFLPDKTSPNAVTKAY